MLLNGSPHTLQNSNSKYQTTKFEEKNRILDHDVYEYGVEYTPKNKEDNSTVVHYGRRQLLINEIEFLTLALKSLVKDFNKSELLQKEIVVIYAGASPGYHFLVLSEFFPFIKFILYDKKIINFIFGDKQYRKNFTINQTFINKSIAENLKKEYPEDKFICLFISDIRRSNKSEEIVEEDMDLQAEIHEILKPYKSFLKFRLPYFNNEKKNKKYLDGTLFFLIYGNPSTSETRLLVDKNAKTRDYDCSRYENQMYYFNNFDRTDCFQHDIHALGIDHCYDCRAHVYILDQYKKIFENVEKMFFPNNFELSRKTIKELVDYINKVTNASSTIINFRYNFENQLYDCVYNFTKIKFGQIIDKEFLNSLRKRNDDDHTLSYRLNRIRI
ncbi:unnamed protein product [Brachionus calyciflorus]|uniref:Cap-specific mRNA (nucleoside-2'-O-)-methyltransferase n=1 Tax=Brachionus calyciflorus TaxID=104777 RepID=A0A814ELL5_9BILA|nr:unnamed protein product [Brachionus calyciflorus]